MKASEFKKLIREEVRRALKEAPSSALVDKASDLYEKILGKSSLQIDDEAIDSAMEKIVRKVGYTPEQKAMNNANVFAFGDFPEFETLNDQQLTAIIKFLEVVMKKGSFDRSDFSKIK